VNCVYCEGKMREGSTVPYMADLYLNLHYSETEYTCPNCYANAYTTNAPYEPTQWVPGRIGYSFQRPSYGEGAMSKNSPSGY
jgi:hypothetical protein